jgi:hypothetical protein
MFSLMHAINRCTTTLRLWSPLQWVKHRDLFTKVSTRLEDMESDIFSNMGDSVTSDWALLLLRRFFFLSLPLFLSTGRKLLLFLVVITILVRMCVSYLCRGIAFWVRKWSLSKKSRCKSSKVKVHILDYGVFLRLCDQAYYIKCVCVARRNF